MAGLISGSMIAHSALQGMQGLGGDLKSVKVESR